MAVFEPFNRLKQCRHGLLLYNIHDLFIGESLEAYGEYSEGEIDLFRQFIKPGQVIVEAGAHIGAHTVFFAQAVAPSGLVIAFEPQRIIFQNLCANLALNSITNVHCFQAAVGELTGELVVPTVNYLQNTNFGSMNLGSHQHGEHVAVHTIDGLKLARCDFIKIDVEGMERAVLAGAAQTIARFKPILYVENDREDKSAALVHAIDALDYKMYWHTPPLFNPANFAGNAENRFGMVSSINMLCVPNARPQNVAGFTQVALPPKP